MKEEVIKGYFEKKNSEDDTFNKKKAESGVYLYL